MPTLMTYSPNPLDTYPLILDTNPMETIQNLLLFTEADSIGSIFVRGLIWVIIVLIMAAGIDNGKSYAKVKADAGWFFLFLLSAGILSYLLFGVAITF